ncbi:MAG TPA: tRNA-uridine aminocarboxypropyltransferase [Clostridiales bacterium]|nr:tRNA-uridine aminocarboxypropyltransferase [Clostridiales bacterium]
MANSGRVSRKCPVCRLFKSICICGDIKKFDLKTRVTLLMHVKEVDRSTNTGKIAELMLTNSKTVIVGAPDGELEQKDIIMDGYENLVLFPHASNVLDGNYVSGLGMPVNLIVPDGNYHQAVKMTRSELLGNLKRVRLPSGQKGEYGLRDSKDPEKVSTIEAVIKALEIIENGPVVAEMNRIFRKMVESFKTHNGRL